MATQTKTIKITAIAPGDTTVTFETTKDNAVPATVTINIHVEPKEILTITSTTQSVSLIEGQSTTIELTFSGDNVTIKNQPDTAIATVTIEN